MRRGKTLLMLDLKHEPAQLEAMALVAQSDALIEGNRPSFGGVTALADISVYWAPGTCGIHRRERIESSEDVVVSKVGRDLYTKFFRGYTRKQWGLDPSELDASVAARVPTRTPRGAHGEDPTGGGRFQASTIACTPRRGVCCTLAQ